MTRSSTVEGEACRRGSVRDQAAPVRTSSSDSDRPRPAGKATKFGEGRSPRGIAPSNQAPKKLGTRIADLESQLGLAQEELKCLKNQLSTTDAARKASDRKPKKPPPKVLEPSDTTDANTLSADIQETDVFEVSIESVPRPQSPTTVNSLTESITVVIQPEKSSTDTELEITTLKAHVAAKDKEAEEIQNENDRLKRELEEKSEKIKSAKSEIDELTTKLERAVRELEESKSNAARLHEQLEIAERAKGELENEMTRVRVQTEQWRKAADAAAAVLMNDGGRRISERCGSMDTNVLERYGIDESEKRKGGMRMLGDLWKKKGGQK